MRIRIERLRGGLLASAVVLALVIGGFIGSARYLRKRLLANIPARLGADVKVDSSGVTWNHVEQGRITYTIHAANEVEHNDGKVALHDVWIKLYGNKQDRADMIRGDEWEWDQKAGVVRALGVVHMELQSAPQQAGAGESARAGTGSGAGSGTGPAGKVMHVTTSSLVYMDKLGIAATSAPIDFESGGITGHAVGADYNSDSGVLMLHSAVNMNGVHGGSPAQLTAGTAELDGRDHVALLTGAAYSSAGRTAAADHATLHLRADESLERVEAEGNVTAQAEGSTVSSARADVAMNEDGYPATALLTGGVKYSADEALRTMHGEATQAAIDFNGKQDTQPQHAVFTGPVHMQERTRATAAAGEPWSTRELSAAKLETALEEISPGRSELRDAEATGSAHMTAVNMGTLAKAHGAVTTELAGDDLKAHLVPGSDPEQRAQLESVAGKGHTLVRQVGADGLDESSVGDTLDARFKPAERGGAKTASGAGKGIVAGGGKTRGTAGGSIAHSQGELGTQMLASAVQDGHVVVTRQAGTKGAGGSTSGTGGERGSDAQRTNDAQRGNDLQRGNDVQRATAERVVYDGDSDRATLTGGVQMAETGSELWANQVTLDHATGDAQAVGAVKVDYAQSASGLGGATRVSAQSGGQSGVQGTGHNGTQSSGQAAAGAPPQPTHVLADRAEMNHATDTATFHGAPARLWQGASQVQAPVIELERTQQRLIARGENTTGWAGAEPASLRNGGNAAQPAVVQTVLMSEGGAQPAQSNSQTGTQACAATAANGGAGASAQTQAVRIASGGLVYSQILGEADFTGGFRAQTGDATIRAGEGIAYLQQQAGNGANAGASSLGGNAASFGGNIDHVTATGAVAIVQPGLRANGERLLYTANDQDFLLTGSAKSPATAVDARGTTTAAALRLHRGCGAQGDLIEALSSAPGEAVQRGHSESQASGGKKEKE